MAKKKGTRKGGGTGRGRGSPRGRSGRPSERLRLVIVLLVLGIGGGIPIAARLTAQDHPDPRPEAAGIALHSPAHHAAVPGIAEAYARAAETPEVLDGLYCYCHCGRHAGHYSLLDCFRDEHAATCGVCLSEALEAYRLSREGRTLPQIRHAVDERFT